jgi:hypothetical protein
MSEITTSKIKGKGSEKKEAASTTKGKHKVTQESELLESEPDDSKQVQEKKPDYLDNQGFDDNGGSSSPKVSFRFINTNLNTRNHTDIKKTGRKRRQKRQKRQTSPKRRGHISKLWM